MLGDQLANVQTEADAFGVDLLSRVEEAEHFEELLLVFPFYADAVIFDLDFDDSVVSKSLVEEHFDLHESISRRELQGVALKVEQHLLESLLVCANLEVGVLKARKRTG